MSRKRFLKELFFQKTHGKMDFLIGGEGSYISVRNCPPLAGGPKFVPVRGVSIPLVGHYVP